MNKDEWMEVQRGFAAPFNPDDVEFRAVSKEMDGKAYCVAYVDARVVAQRLDDVAGVGNWAFEWEAVSITDKGVTAAKGTLTVYGVAKSDIGDADNREVSKSSVSDALKRAAVLWGIGRYLYNLSNWFVPVKAVGGGLVPTDEAIAYMRGVLRGDNPSKPTAGATRPNQASGYRNQGNYVAVADSEPSADEQYEALGNSSGTYVNRPIPESELTPCPKCGKPVKAFTAKSTGKAYFREASGGFHNFCKAQPVAA